MSSAGSTNGISRRAVLAGAAAIGGTIAVASALGTGVTTAQAAPSVTGTAGATGANSAGGVTVPAAQRTTKSVKTVTDAPALPGWKVAPFPLRNVAITSNSVFDRAKEGMLDYARNYPVDRWLVCFRAQANLLPKDNTTQPSGGWENFPNSSLDKAIEQQWGDAEYTRGQNKNGADGLLRGHFAGHALHMLSQAYAETGEEAILNKINEFVSGLKECRDALREMKYNGKARYTHPGFLAAYGEWQFKALEEYAPYGEIWAPWYTEHKILAGLIAAYEFAGNADALDLAEGIGHWTYARLSKCTKTQLQKMWDIYIGGEYGGMNDSLVDLYNVSKDKDRSEFLKASAFFDTDKLIDNCGAGVDILNNLHANQHIPQFVGYAKDAAMGDADIDADARARYLKAVEGYWGMIVPGRMYAHGGTGEGEMWGPAHTVAGDIGKRNAESCAAYNMLKVARYLFFIEQKPAYMDYYERTILNHILGGKSRDLDSGTALTPGNCYMYPVNPATQKEYGDGNIGTCCGGTALESHSKYQDSIYFHSTDNKELYVNLFTASTLDWTDTGLKLAQETNYPEEETSTISITAAPKSAVTFRIRIPAWSKGAKIEVNGKAVDGVTAGEYATVAGSWKVGDEIVVTIPLQLRTESTDDRKDIQALFYGPTVLNALNPSTKFIQRGFYERNGLDGTIKLGVQKKEGTKNYFIIDGDEFEPAYNGDNTPYHMYFQRKDEYVGFAGKLTDVLNPKRPAAQDRSESTLMDDIWAGAPFKDRAAFIKKVQEVTKTYQDEGLLSSRDRQVVLLASARAKMS